MTQEPRTTGTCRECGKEGITLTADGLVRVHGPRDERCEGSGKLPDTGDADVSAGPGSSPEADAARARIAAGPSAGPNPYRPPLPTDQPSSAPADPSPEDDYRRFRAVSVRTREDAATLYQELVQDGLHRDFLAELAQIMAAALVPADEASEFVATDAAEPEPGPGNWFPARFDGDCDGCGADFGEGEDIRADGKGGWQGRECCGEGQSARSEVPRTVRHKVPIEAGRYRMPHPQTGRKWAGTRVTTFVKRASDHMALKLWEMRCEAVGFVLRPDLLAQVAALVAGREDEASAVVKESRVVLDRLADQAKDSAGAKNRARHGTVLHKHVEEVNAGRRAVAGVPEAYRSDVEVYAATLAAAGIRAIPHLVECTTALVQLSVMGTWDIILELSDGTYAVGDVKTGDLTYGQAEIATQMGVYARGGNETGYAAWDGYGDPRQWDSWGWRKLEEADGRPIVLREDIGIVIHIPYGKDTCTLYEVDLDTGWRGAQLCAQVRDWQKVKSTMVPLPVPDPETPLPGMLPPEEREPEPSAFLARLEQESGGAGTVLDRMATAVRIAAEPTWEERWARITTQQEAAELYDAAWAHPEVGTDRLRSLVAIGQRALIDNVPF